MKGRQSQRNREDIWVLQVRTREECDGIWYPTGRKYFSTRKELELYVNTERLRIGSYLGHYDYRPKRYWPES